MAPGARGPANPLLKFLDGVFLWIPRDRKPGVPALLLVLVRQVNSVGGRRSSAASRTGHLI
jgi:hypothetical protein